MPSVSSNFPTYSNTVTRDPLGLRSEVSFDLESVMRVTVIRNTLKKFVNLVKNLDENQRLDASRAFSAATILIVGLYPTNIIIGFTDSKSIYLRIYNKFGYEVHLELFYESTDHDGIEAVTNVYKNDRIVLKAFGLMEVVLNKIKNKIAGEGSSSQKVQPIKVMPYPFRLLATTEDRIITDEHLNRNEILCRWVSPSKQLKDEDGLLAAEAVEENKMHGYSVNKIPPSEVSDIEINFYDNDKFYQAWVEGEIGYEPADAEYDRISTRQYFLFKIADVHEYEGVYPYPYNSEEYYVFKLKVVHKPLISIILTSNSTMLFLKSTGKM